VADESDEGRSVFAPTISAGVVIDAMPMEIR
jgi:hypothetical protein